MTNTMTRSQARRWTLGAQLASGVFVLAAVGIGVVGLPQPKSGATITTTTGMPAISTEKSPATGSKTDPADALTQHQSIDTLGLAQRLALLENAPTIIDNTVYEPIAGNPGGTGSSPSTQTDGSIAKRVRYIGYINDPTTRHAFIRIDGKQRIVALGAIAKTGNPDFPNLTLKQIMPQYILMSDGQFSARINLADRIGQSITMAGGGKVDVSNAVKNGSMLTAADEAAIAAMPPRQQPMARRRLERERRGLPPKKPNRRPVIEPLGRANGNFNSKRNNRNN